MAFVVETGVGLEDANSYCTVEFADGYNATQIDGQDWADVDLPDKRISLITAAQILDNSFDYDGRRLTRTQGLEFPRWGVRDRGGLVLPTAPLPRFIKCANAELARILRQRADAGISATGPSVAAASTTTGAVKQIQVGTISLTLDTSSATTSSGGSVTAANTSVSLIPRSVTAWLLDYAVPRFGHGSARLVR